MVSDSLQSIQVIFNDNRSIRLPWTTRSYRIPRRSRPQLDSLDQADHPDPRVPLVYQVIILRRLIDFWHFENPPLIYAILIMICIFNRRTRFTWSPWLTRSGRTKRLPWTARRNRFTRPRRRTRTIWSTRTSEELTASPVVEDHLAHKVRLVYREEMALPGGPGKFDFVGYVLTYFNIQ